MSEEKKDMSRRNFLRSGILAAGALAVGAGAFAPLGGGIAKASETSNTTPGLPWPYTPLDPATTKALAYKGYGMHKCSFGAFYAIMSQLQEKVGPPYTMIPMEIMQWGETGGAGWATLCGALIGASTAINFVVGPKQEDVLKVVNELIGWYTTAKFPEYIPPAGKALAIEGALPTSVSGSPLCHVSVGNWCQVSNFKAEGKERSDRCGRVAADVAGKAVELLNAWHSQTFAAAYKDPDTVKECMICHGKGASLEDARGKQDCVQCHTDVQPNDLLAHIKKSWNMK